VELKAVSHKTRNCVALGEDQSLAVHYIEGLLISQARCKQRHDSRAPHAIQTRENGSAAFVLGWP